MSRSLNLLLRARRMGQAEVTARIDEHYLARARTFMDLSVLHDNTQAIALYEKLGFQRVPAFCVKHKNPINEELFVGPPADVELNPYAALIVNEARRRNALGLPRHRKRAAQSHG